MSGAITAGTIATVAGISAAGSIGSAVIGSHAAGKAADAQSSAANHAADLQYQASQNALGFQKQQYNTSQQELAPWLQSGQGALTNLNYLLGLGPSQGGQPGQVPQPGQPSNGVGVPARPVGPSGYGGQPQSMALPRGSQGGYSPVATNAGPASGTSLPGAPVGGQPSTGVQGYTPNTTPPNTSLGAYGSLMQPYGQTFKAPTAEEARLTPGYQFAQQEGQNALERSAAARGGILTGGTAKALDQYSQGLADTNYQNVYQNALNTYGTNFNAYNANQANQYNRLASLSGVGQQTAQQLGLLGNQASQGISSNLLNTAQNMGQDYQNAGAANASGYVGAANAWGGALGGVSNNLSNLLMLKQLTGGGGTSPVYGGGSLYGI